MMRKIFQEIRRKIGYLRYCARAALREWTGKAFQAVLNAAGLGELMLGRMVHIEQHPELCRQLEVFLPRETVTLGDPGNEAFLAVSKHYGSGSFVRKSVFVCDLRPALLYPDTGVVCTADHRVIVESIMQEARFSFTGLQYQLRPLRYSLKTGLVTSIQRVFSLNFWHWMVDSLPQVYSLVQAVPEQELTILMPATLPASHRESLACVLPAHFRVEYVAPKRWIRAEKFLLASQISGLCNGFLPEKYYDFLRHSTFEKLQIKPSASPGKRIYLTRAGCGHRRVLNEDRVMDVLRPLGFEEVAMGSTTFREQVEMFRNAEAIVAPHGAALGGILFSEKAKVGILYPEPNPGEYFFTLTRGLGLPHYYRTHNSPEHCDFEVDLKGLDQMVRVEMCLS